MQSDEENPTIRYNKPSDQNIRSQPSRPDQPETPTVRYSDTKVISQLPSLGGEADISILEIKGKKYIRKFYRYGITPKEEILKKVREISNRFPQFFIVQHKYGINSRVERWYEMLEYAPHQSLKELLAQGTLSNDNIRILLKQITSALEILHSQGIIHLDLKPANILIRSLKPFTPVIADFGASSLLDPEMSKRLTELKGTFSYWAPEQISGIIGKQCDYWALGVILYESILGSNPFQGVSREVVIRDLITIGINLPPSIPDMYASLLQGLLLQDPKSRWGKAEIDRWLKGENNIPIQSGLGSITSGKTLSSSYPFEGEKYFNLHDLIKAFGSDPKKWESAKKHINRGYIGSWLEKNGEFDLAVQVADITERSKNQDHQVSLLIAKFCPELPYLFRAIIVDLNNLVLFFGKYLQNETNEVESALCASLLEGSLLAGYEQFCQIRKMKTEGVLQQAISFPKKIKGKNNRVFRVAIFIYLSSLLESPTWDELLKNIERRVNSLVKRFSASGKYQDGLDLIEVFEYSLSIKELSVDLKIKMKNALDEQKKKRYDNLLKRFGELIQQGKSEEALAECEKAIKKDPRFAGAWGIMGNIFLISRNYQSAIEAYDKSINIDPNNSQIWINKGISLATLSMNEEAIAAFDNGIQLDPNNSDHWHIKGDFLRSIKKYEDAICAFDEAIKIDPENILVWYQKGYALSLLGRHEEAITALNKVIKIDPKNSRAWSLKGCSLLRLNRHKEGLDAFDKAIEIDPTNISVLNDKGRILAAIEKYEEAIPIYDKILKIDPTNITALESLGYAYGSLNKYNDAIGVFKFLIEVDPNNFAAWINMGKALFNLYNYREALMAFNRAIEIDSGIADAWICKGGALKALGRYEESFYAWKMAASLESNGGG